MDGYGMGWEEGKEGGFRYPNFESEESDRKGLNPPENGRGNGRNRKE